MLNKDMTKRHLVQPPSCANSTPMPLRKLQCPCQLLLLSNAGGGDDEDVVIIPEDLLPQPMTKQQQQQQSLFLPHFENKKVESRQFFSCSDNFLT